MKSVISIFVYPLFFLSSSLATGSSSTDNKITLCTNSLSQVEINAFKKEANLLNKEIHRLCLNKNRNKAQNLALGLAHKIQKSPTLTQLRRCNDIAIAPFTEVQKLTKQYFVSTLRFTHICDSY